MRGVPQAHGNLGMRYEQVYGAEGFINLHDAHLDAIALLANRPAATHDVDAQALAKAQQRNIGALAQLSQHQVQRHQHGAPSDAFIAGVTIARLVEIIQNVVRSGRDEAGHQRGAVFLVHALNTVWRHMKAFARSDEFVGRPLPLKHANFARRFPGYTGKTWLWAAHFHYQDYQEEEGTPCGSQRAWFGWCCWLQRDRVTTAPPSYGR